MTERQGFAPSRRGRGGFGSRRRSEPAPIPDLSGRRILIVEDVIANSLMLSEMLEPTGAEIDTVETGEDAIDRPADLVLMDILLPGIDGIEAARRIRAGGGTQPIITLSGYVRTVDDERSRAAGISAHIAKPLEIDHLYTVIAEHLQPI